MTEVDARAAMGRALELARRGLFTAHPNPRVGCVIERDGQRVGEGWHEYTGGPHAEINALAAAGERARGATVYVTLEPCVHHGRTPPCTEALIAAGVAHVVYAASDPNPRVAGAGAGRLRAAGIRVEGGLLAREAAALNQGCELRMTRARPFVRVKLAASRDGRTALADGRSQWITGEAARADGHRWRARSGAILTGVGTVLADDPALTVRLDGLGPRFRQPRRVVLDSALRTPPTARLFAGGGEVHILTSQDPPERRAPLEAAGARVTRLPADDRGGVGLAATLEALAALEVNELLVESGPGVAGALLSAGLVDELIVYMASHVIGSSGRGMFDLPPLREMAARAEFELCELRAVGADLRLRYTPRVS